MGEKKLLSNLYFGRRVPKHDKRTSSSILSGLGGRLKFCKTDWYFIKVLTRFVDSSWIASCPLSSHPHIADTDSSSYLHGHQSNNSARISISERLAHAPPSSPTNNDSHYSNCLYLLKFFLRFRFDTFLTYSYYYTTVVSLLSFPRVPIKICYCYCVIKRKRAKKKILREIRYPGTHFLRPHRFARVTKYIYVCMYI